MNDVLTVSFSQCGADLADDAGGGCGQHGTVVLDDGAQVAALDEFHDQEDDAVANTEVVDGDDVGVLEASCGLGLALEAFGKLRIA